MSVKVAVRVRTFNQREKELQSQLCVDMIGQKTVLQDSKNPQKNREFQFDYSFWSHDGFENNENGLSIGTNTRYADQQRVFDSFGHEILSNTFEGNNCCLFAYGATGTGKSYSMFGQGVNKGIVPNTCEAIFERINQNQDQNKQYEISVSMFEIYHDKVQDLMIALNKRPAEGLKVREDKLVYLEGLTKYKVDTYEALQAKINYGNREQQPRTSSAHTIVQIEFKQNNFDGQNTEKISVINFVDLAGSEMPAKTGSQGQRLKEANTINSSLTVLGQVLAALAQKSKGESKNFVVPYRASLITRILQNSLEDNSKILILCTISPATYNYDETLTTLRYTDQIKKIKKVNTNVNGSDIQQQIEQEEITTLEEQLVITQSINNNVNTHMIE